MYPAAQKQAVANLFEDCYLIGLVGLNILKRRPHQVHELKISPLMERVGQHMAA